MTSEISADGLKGKKLILLKEKKLWFIMLSVGKANSAKNKLKMNNFSNVAKVPFFSCNSQSKVKGI